jgi:hypothetical protein
MRGSFLRLTDLHSEKTPQRFTTKIMATLLAVMAILTLAQMLSVGEALAQTPEVKLEAVPESMELPAKGDAEVQVVVRNPTEDMLDGIKLSWFTSTNLNITVLESQDGKPVAPKTEAVWILKLSHGDEGLVSGKIHFRVNYGVKATKGVSGVRVAFGTLEVKGREADAIEKVAQVEVKTSITSLNETRKGKIYLVVTNKSEQEIRLGTVSSNNPTFIKVESDLKDVQKIAPHSSRSLPINVELTDTVESGKHLVVFQVPVEWGTKERLQKATLVAQQELTTGVFGESEILTALGVPSFLILPGVLMIITYAMLSRFGDAKTGDDDSLLKIGANPQFWVIAITLSIFMALLYPAITGLLYKVRRNYIGAYGLKDVVNIWFISILIGVVARGLVYAYKMLVAMYYTPSENDSPIKILRKLRWQKLGIILPRVKVKIGQTEVAVFRIQERKGNQKTFWVAPYINMTWQNAADDTFKAAVDTQMERGRKISDLIALLKQKDKVNLQWDKTGVIGAPHYTSEAEFIEGEQGEQSIIKQE